MATRDPEVMGTLGHIRTATTSPRVASAVAELLAWYEELSLRRVRGLVANLCQALNDQRDYPPIAEIISLYDRFLEMTRGQEEKAEYTLDVGKTGIIALYVVETYEYADSQAELTIRETRWYHLFTSPRAYQQHTGRAPHEDIGKPLEYAHPWTFGMDGFLMQVRDPVCCALLKAWFQRNATPEILVRQERYIRRANQLIFEASA